MLRQVAMWDFPCFSEYAYQTRICCTDNTGGPRNMSSIGTANNFFLLCDSGLFSFNEFQLVSCGSESEFGTAAIQIIIQENSNQDKNYTIRNNTIKTILFLI